MGKPPKIRKPTKEQMEEKWKSTNPRDLAYEIATFMGGEWPERPVRAVQLSMEGAPTECEDLMELTQLNPTLLSEMTVPTRELFLEVYYDDIQDVYSEVRRRLSHTAVTSHRSATTHARPPAPSAPPPPPLRPIRRHPLGACKPSRSSCSTRVSPLRCPLAGPLCPTRLPWSRPTHGRRSWRR